MIKILGIIIFIALLTSSAYLIFYKNSQPEPILQSPLTYEECKVFPNAKNVESLPNKCITPDGVVFIEELKRPLSTENWTVFNTKLGFTLKCPPYWDCRTTEGVVYITAGYYAGGMTIQKVTVDNFQESQIRHPKYSTPVAWFNDLQQGRKQALEVDPQTVWAVPNTDATNSPLYAGTKIEGVKEIIVQDKKGIVISSLPESSLILPLNKTDVVILQSQTFEEPVALTIAETISPLQ